MKRITTLLAVLVLVSGAMTAVAQTTVVTDWDISGNFNFDFQAGDDARFQFSTGGFHAWGQATTTDSGDNPYNYGVDTVSAQTKANIDGGGYINARMERNDSKSSMYGEAGQYTVTNIYSADGTAFFATNTRSNFADMITANYSYQSANQYQAAGTLYSIWHKIFAAEGEYAEVGVLGSGSANITLMSDEMRGSGWRFGEGAGCYTAASASGAGSGEFYVYGQAPNNLAVPFGAVGGGGSWLLEINYNNGFNVNPINMSGN